MDMITFFSSKIKFLFNLISFMFFFIWGLHLDHVQILSFLKDQIKFIFSAFFKQLILYLFQNYFLHFNRYLRYYFIKLILKYIIKYIF